MSQNSLNTKENIINVVDLYVSKWKIIVACLLIALTIGYLKVRYSTYEYQANASIKIKEDENSQKLSEISAVQNYGLFSNNFTKVTDEIEIIKSRSIITQVVKDLKLNIRYFVSGQVKEEEVYLEPPVNISFIMNDSLVENIDTNLFITIISPQEFELSDVNTKKILDFSSAKTSVHSFGKKVKSKFGEFVLTPNIGTYGSEIDSHIEIRIRPVHTIVETYLDKIKIESNPKSNVLKLSVKESNKEKARLVLNKLIEKYNEDVINDKEPILSPIVLRLYPTN